MFDEHPTAEGRMESALKGCFAFFAIAAVIIGCGGWLIIEWILR